MEYVLGILCVAWTLHELRGLLRGVRRCPPADPVIELRRVECRTLLPTALGCEPSVWQV